MYQATTSPPPSSLFFMSSLRTAANIMNKKRPLHRRYVTFAPMVTVTESPRATPDEAQHVWYTPHDLASFKANARRIARHTQHDHHQHGAVPLTDNLKDDDESRRGLENCTRAHQKQRRRTIKYTLTAYRRGLTQEQTATVSAKCSSWGRHQAFVLACHDYAEIYQPAMLALIPALEVNPPAFPLFGSNNQNNSTSNCAASVSPSTSDDESPGTGSSTSTSNKRNLSQSLPQMEDRNVRQRVY